ncbi:MAG TPA: hypothetical protein VFO91_07590 [Anaerolineales bacterium]|nr:hypothetical protein [Anaerolineales bacterium]
MNIREALPHFDVHFADLDQYIRELVEAYKTGKIRSWDDLAERVNAYFTPERMEDMEARASGWRKMASYREGMTLVHVMCVFLGLYMMPEFLSMTREQQQIMKWVILFHDIEKEPQEGKRDHAHAFRSAVAAARILPKLGFPVTVEYDSLIDGWAEYTRAAITKAEGSPHTIQDNRRLPEILDGIEKMFEPNSPAALIIKTILFHLSSIDMLAWPAPSPLTEEEVSRYFNADLVLLLRAMNLGDSEGWNMFNASREPLRQETLRAFEKVEQLIHDKDEVI